MTGKQLTRPKQEIYFKNDCLPLKIYLFCYKNNSYCNAPRSGASRFNHETNLGRLVRHQSKLYEPNRLS